MSEPGPPLVIRSSIFNAFLPILLKNTYRILPWLIVFSLILSLINFFLMQYTVDILLIIIFGFYALILFILTCDDFVLIYFTRFYFYSHYLEVRFNFFSQKTKTIYYNNISDVRVSANWWDYITNVGDITLIRKWQEDQKETKVVIRNVKKPNDLRDAIARRVSELS